MSKEQDNYQLIYQDKIRRNLLEVKSVEKIFFLARHIAEQVRKFSWASLYALEAVLKETYSNPCISAAILIERVPANSEKKLLDIFVFFITDPNQENTSGVPASSTLNELHNHLQDQLMHTVDSNLCVVPPNTYASLEQFLAALPLSLPKTRSLRALGCLRTSKAISSRKFFNNSHGPHQEDSGI